MIDQKQILEEVANSLALPVADIDPESHLRDDLGLNRVEIADLFSNLSIKYHIFFDPTEIEQVDTVSDLVELVEDKLLE